MNEPQNHNPPPRESHFGGLLLAVLVYMMIADIAVVVPHPAMQLGYRWQACLFQMSPLICVFACLIVSVLAPVGNNSRFAPFRVLGRVSVSARYLLFAVILAATVGVGTYALHLLVLFSNKSP